MSTDDDDDGEYIIHGKLLDPIHEGKLFSFVTDEFQYFLVLTDLS